MTSFASQTTTVITAPNPGTMSPLEAAMMDACNELHEVAGAGDDSRVRELETLLGELLERYEACNAEDHPQPKWAVPHQRALFMSAAGDVEGAVIYEDIAFQHAQTDRQREISLGNLADRYMRLERFDAAVEHFLKARQVAPRSVPIMLTGAQALYLAGFRAESDRIFKALLQMPELLKHGTDLTAYLDFETRLQVMRPDLPSLDRLMAAWEAVGGRGRWPVTNSKHTTEIDHLTDLDQSVAPQATGTPMNEAQQNEFWQQYAKIAMPAIERACRSFARSLTDNAMSAEDMQAWVDDRVWKMVRLAAWPVFHDNPTPQAAAERVVEKSKLLARWAYIALSRQTWRRKAREAKLISGMSRSERLASVSSAPVDFEKFEQIAEDMDRVRQAVSERVRAHVAASWHDPEDRRRIALALDATKAADDKLITRADTGEIKPNTLDQMRCRSRKEIRSILRPGTAIFVLVASAVLTLFAGPARAGEQTGGRPGRGDLSAQVAGSLAHERGEQTGGRPGR